GGDSMRTMSLFAIGVAILWWASSASAQDPPARDSSPEIRRLQEELNVLRAQIREVNRKLHRIREALDGTPGPTFRGRRGGFSGPGFPEGRGPGRDLAGPGRGGPGFGGGGFGGFGGFGPPREGTASSSPMRGFGFGGDRFGGFGASTGSSSSFGGIG